MAQHNDNQAPLPQWDKAVMIPTDCIVMTDWNCNEMTEEKLGHLLAAVKNEAAPDRERRGSRGPSLR